MKKAIVFCLLVSLAGSLFANEGDDYEATFLPPKEVKAIGFKAEFKDNKVYFSWKQYLREDFVFYKVVRSSTNPNPVYPKDEYIYYTDQRDITQWTDPDPVPGTWYYSLTIVTKKNERWTAVPIKLKIEFKPGPVPDTADFK